MESLSHRKKKMKSITPPPKASEKKLVHVSVCVYQLFLVSGQKKTPPLLKSVTVSSPKDFPFPCLKSLPPQILWGRKGKV
jgi:hypothetical protein